MSRKAVPFTNDVRDAALDSILDHALNLLYPYLSKTNNSTLAYEAAQHLTMHLPAELKFIATGKADDGTDFTSPTTTRLRQRFMRDAA